MTYPKRVAWQFRNVTQDFNMWPTLDSVNIDMSNPLDIATFSFDVVDKDGDITIDLEDEIWVKAGGTKVFAGHIKTRTRTQVSETTGRKYECDAQDYTAKLDDSVIDHRKSRGKEDVAARVAWILSFLNYPITDTNVSLPTFEMEKNEYDGMTVREALEQVADEARLSFYVDFDKDLHMFRTETDDADFELDDLTPDFVDSFPYVSFGFTDDSVELAERVYVRGEKRAVWVGTPGGQERTVDSSELSTASALTKAGDRAIAENGTPQIDGTFVCHQPGLRGGQRINLKNDFWGIDAHFFLTQVTLTAVDPHDENGKAYLYSTCDFSDRRKARSRPYKPRGGKEGEAEDGDAVPVYRACMSANRNRIQALGGAVPAPLADDVSYDSPVPPAHNEVVSMSPSYRRSYIASPGCGPGFQAAHTGWLTEEQYIEADLTGLDVAGASMVRFTYDTSNLNNVDGKQLAYGILKDGPPDHEYQYELLGYCPIDGGAFEIPINMFNSTGVTWVVIAPGWTSVWGVECCDSALLNGLEGPLGGISPGGGEFNSGSVQIDNIEAVLRVNSGGGLQPWGSVGGVADGSNRIFELPDWNGKGVPQIRIGAIEYAAGSDFTYDEDDGEIAFNFAPWPGAEITGRWKA